MQAENIGQTGGAGFTTDALPFKDMAATGEPDFEVRDGVVMLRGSRSRSSGSLAFPRREVCIETGARDMEPVSFGPLGTLYSYSTVHVSSSRQVPYTIGYVDLENGVRVLAAVHAQAEELRCDLPVELRTDGESWFVAPVAAR
jgi:uncharacterized OB-fold protein